MSLKVLQRSPSSCGNQKRAALPGRLTGGGVPVTPSPVFWRPGESPDRYAGGEQRPLSNEDRAWFVATILIGCWVWGWFLGKPFLHWIGVL